MTGRRFMSLILCVVLLTCFTVEATASPLVFKLAGQNPDNHPATKAMQAMADEIGRKTNGRVEVKVYPANQLGSYSLVYEELMRGTIEMAATSIASDFDQRWDLLYTHGYSSSYEKVEKAYDPNGWFFKKIGSLLSVFGVKLLGLYFDGMVGVSSTKPLIEPLNPKVDKGVLMRVPQMDVHREPMLATGFRTIGIPYSDVYQSIATGVCDGDAGLSIVATYTMLRDAIKHYYVFNKNTEVLPIVISGKAWALLSDKDKEIVKEAASKYAHLSIENAKANDYKYLDMMREKGIIVHMYTPEELKPLTEAYISTWSKLDKSKGKELMDEFKTEMSEIPE